MELWDSFTRFVLPPILGGIGGYLAAWLQWDLEKRRARRQRRVDLIASWRANLLPALAGEEGYGLGYTGHAITDLPDYATLRPHLSAEFLAEVEKRGERTFVVAGTPFLRKELMSEIDRIEKRWDLV